MVHPCEHAAALGAPSDFDEADFDEALAYVCQARVNDKIGAFLPLHCDLLARYLEHVRPDHKGN
jgi:hypothetical protein